MKKTLFFILFLFLISFSYAATQDEYKPYLHKPSVPDHPKLKQYGMYSTSIFTGGATYSYDLELPKGNNGLTPSISVLYNSQSAKQRTMLCSGWSLTQNIIYTDKKGTISDTSDDVYKLVLNNNAYELVNVNGTYKTKIES